MILYGFVVRYGENNRGGWEAKRKAVAIRVNLGVTKFNMKRERKRKRERKKERKRERERKVHNSHSTNILQPYINPILGPFLKLYNQYIDKYELKKKKFSQATKTYKDFGILVEEFQAKPSCKGLTLLHHMLTPIQR